MRLSTLYCIRCGEKHGGDVTPDGEPIPCSSCNRQPVDLPTLMLGLNILDVTLRLCGKCKASAPAGNKYCYRCGKGLG